ncbi:uncharacterized protein YcbK (DUF882 family) [Rhizobium sp. SG_E_25_P2]|uniref:YcbK family protein n=1 Tax=Rhizobium sp. SG_E_25_P2 TaxID=2879942 RepID=UPI002476D1CF|nr:D-Ala-D-Ala carboxypeptidase family metallohydrolase [Rhizobium sp. SG_E_25_P2]MDH6268997.1 uncharacterized protein YcbK (DUF882 family) [Rhizobium sp. SG_E_25_P2]
MSLVSRPAIRLALLLASVACVSSCMSSPGVELAAIQTNDAPRATAAQSDAATAPQDASKIASQAYADIQSMSARDASVVPDSWSAEESNGEPAAPNVAAAQNSIFSTRAGQPQNGQPAGVNASQNSIYAGAVAQSRDVGAIPLPSADLASEAQDLALAGLPIPEELASADPAAAQAEQAKAMPSYRAALANNDAETKAKAAPRSRRVKTLADFFRSSVDDDKERKTASFNRSRFGESPRQLTTASIPNMRTANVGGEDLPGVNAMMPTGRAPDVADEDDQPAGLMKLASLSGMARLGPNGLWTQTDEVQISCLRPQLVGMLKMVEKRYNKPVMVTSGFRDPRHNRVAGGARHSLHTLCAAADIQVEGVSKWELADYLRSLPGRGGVGTYCHTQSVHVDIGSQRDWNWRCRRSSRRS